MITFRRIHNFLAESHARSVLGKPVSSQSISFLDTEYNTEVLDLFDTECIKFLTEEQKEEREIRVLAHTQRINDEIATLEERSSSYESGAYKSIGEEMSAFVADIILSGVFDKAARQASENLRREIKKCRKKR